MRSDSRVGNELTKECHSLSMDHRRSQTGNQHHLVVSSTDQSSLVGLEFSILWRSPCCSQGHEDESGKSSVNESGDNWHPSWIHILNLKSLDKKRSTKPAGLTAFDDSAALSKR